jgi:hypothetical protein
MALAMPVVPITVAEVDPFDASARRAGLSEAARTELVEFLARNPEAGDLIQGTGGLRKLRWAGKGKGKRGGYRAIYYYFTEEVPIYLLAIYAKNQQIDLNTVQKARLSELAEQLKTSARKIVRLRIKR